MVESTNNSSTGVLICQHLTRAIVCCDESLRRATGLDEMSRRTCAIYAVATHFMDQVKQFPVLDIHGSAGTGKSSTLRTMKLFCLNPVTLAVKGMTYPAIRDELAKARLGTAIVEEADDINVQTQFENLLLQRYGRDTAMTAKMVPTNPDKPGLWQLQETELFGATVVHKRELFLDHALESRAILVRACRNEERDYDSYEVIAEDDDLVVAYRCIMEEVQSIQLPSKVAIPEDYHIAARIFDTWRPLLIVAQLAGDKKWLPFAFEQMNTQSESLKDGQSYENSGLVLQALLSALAVPTKTDPKEYKLDFSKRISVNSDIVALIKKDYNRFIQPGHAARILREFGFSVRRTGGSNHMYADFATLVKACRTSGLEDDLLTKEVEKQAMQK